MKGCHLLLHHVDAVFAPALTAASLGIWRENAPNPAHRGVSNNNSTSPNPPTPTWKICIKNAKTKISHRRLALFPIITWKDRPLTRICKRHASKRKSTNTIASKRNRKSSKERKRNNKRQSANGVARRRPRPRALPLRVAPRPAVAATAEAAAPAAADDPTAVPRLLLLLDRHKVAGVVPLLPPRTNETGAVDPAA